MRIKTTNEIQPGKIFYDVNGHSRTKTRSNSIGRNIIASRVYMVQLSCGAAPFFDVLVEYENCFGEKYTYKSNRSAHDLGIFLPDEKQSCYNLNRGFWSIHDAEKFVSELRSDKFSDPMDREYAERKPAAEDLRQQAENLRWDTLCDYMEWDDENY